MRYYWYVHIFPNPPSKFLGALLYFPSVLQHLSCLKLFSFLEPSTAQYHIILNPTIRDRHVCLASSIAMPGNRQVVLPRGPRLSLERWTAKLCLQLSTFDLVCNAHQSPSSSRSIHVMQCSQSLKWDNHGPAFRQTAQPFTL